MRRILAYLFIVLPVLAFAQNGSTCETAIAADADGFRFAATNGKTWYKFTAKERRCKLDIPQGVSFLLFEDEKGNFCEAAKQPSIAVHVLAKRGELAKTAGIGLPLFTEEELKGKCACDVCANDRFAGDLWLKKDAVYYLLVLSPAKDIKMEFINVPVTDTEIKEEKKEEPKNEVKETAQKLTTLKVGETLALKNILFYPGTSKLLPGSDADMEAVLAFMRANPTVKIEVQGHVHGTPIVDDDVPLSVERALVVYNYLLSNGIGAGRLTYKGYGVSKLIYTGRDPGLQQQNRRVEILILEK